ncbi:MAG: helix-turn-helix domain-containing protein [Candidatus Bathyarchaeia archaeon]
MISEATREALSQKIAAEIVLSLEPGKTMRKWRDVFDVPQKTLAKEMGVSPSVLSDYESGRRRSPGSFTVQKFVGALIGIDEKRGGDVIKSMARALAISAKAIIDVRDFPVPLKVSDIVKAVDGTVVACDDRLDDPIYGYTIIDSLEAIRTLSGHEFIRVMGMTTERALIFTGVTTGRSPMIAIRVQTPKPRAVVLQGPIAEGEVDKLALELAGYERIPLIVARRGIDEIRGELKKLVKR